MASLPAGMASLPAGMASLPAGRASLPAGKASLPAGMASLPAGMALSANMPETNAAPEFTEQGEWDMTHVDGSEGASGGAPDGGLGEGEAA
jgi:hypothetical protein